MQRDNKCLPFVGKKAAKNKQCPQIQMLELVDKNFKSTIMKRFKEIKETVSNGGDEISTLFESE